MSSPLKQNTITIESILETINNLPDAGTDTLDATATANNILTGKTAYVSEGKVTGTMPDNGDVSGTIDGAEVTEITIPAGYTSGGTIGFVSTVIEEELDEQTDLIAQIQSAVDSLPEAGGGEPTLQEKTVSPTTSSQSVTPDSGYDGLSRVTVNAMPTATQATPSISVSSAGLITASATQTAGYVTAGTKSGTKQLTTQASKTITPSTSSQTAVSSGVYTTGAVTVAAIPSNYIVPSGTKTITTNGTHDVKNYASATVNVAGEDVTTETNAYTTKLASLETAITALETELQGKAGGGSGGGSAETCDVTLTANDPNTEVYYIDNSGVIQLIAPYTTGSVTINTAKNSMIFVRNVSGVVLNIYADKSLKQYLGAMQCLIAICESDNIAIYEMSGGA